MMERQVEGNNRVITTCVGDSVVIITTHCIRLSMPCVGITYIRISAGTGTNSCVAGANIARTERIFKDRTGKVLITFRRDYITQFQGACLVYIYVRSTCQGLPCTSVMLNFPCDIRYGHDRIQNVCIEHHLQPIIRIGDINRITISHIRVCTTSHISLIVHRRVFKSYISNHGINATR